MTHDIVDTSIKKHSPRFILFYRNFGNKCAVVESVTKITKIEGSIGAYRPAKFILEVSLP